jgi:hypothetical protein
MGYFDGNTVTALWNYAQHFAMNDNSFSSTFGPSTPGVLNLVSGQTNGVVSTLNGTGDEIDGGNGWLTVIGDPDPLGDVCSNATRNQVQMKSKNIGDLLRAAGVSWGAFMGGFNLSTVNPDGSTGCSRSSTGLAGSTNDFIPHHAFFQYYASTANPNHTRPRSLAEIGNDGPANHQYDLADFFGAVKAGHFPAVNFIKAKAFQDGHAGYSDPLDEQAFLVALINFLQEQEEWKTRPLSSCTTTRTAGTTINSGRLSTPPAEPRMPSPAPARAEMPPRLCPVWIQETRTPSAAAVMARGSRSSSSRRGQRRTSSTAPSPTKAQSCGLSRTTGLEGSGSAKAALTKSPDRSTTCSISPGFVPTVISS